MPLPNAFRALAHRNYRLFLVGQGVSMMGTWMQTTGLSWLVYKLTNDSFLLGLVSFCGQIPAFFLSPIAGVMSDRFDRRRTLFVTQTISMIQAVSLVALTWTGHIEIWQIIALSAVLGMVNAFDMPTRQAFLSDMAPTRVDLPNAIALNSSMFNLSRLIGPVIGGAILARWGATACFLANAISYTAVIAALAAMTNLPVRVAPRLGRVSSGLAEGFKYAFGFAPIRALLMMIAMVSLLGMPISTLLPVFAKDVLHGEAQTFGYLLAASGAGALTGALYLANRRSVVGLGKPIGGAAVTFGASMIAFSFSQSVLLSCGILLIAGFSMLLTLAGCNTLLQTIVDDDKRGRIMSLYAMAFMGTVPVGSLLAGTLADEFGAPLAARINGVLCIVGATAFILRLPSLRKQVLPIYQRVGLVPPITAAVEAVAELQAAPEDA